MIQRAKELGYQALCITDHGVLYNAPEIYLACKDAEIGYIYGCELYICDDKTIKDNTNRYYHLIALAYNEEGRINLNKIITDAYENGFYYKPRTDFDFLSRHAAGLVITSACMAGEVSRALEQGGDATSLVERYKGIFGDNYYLEVQAHDVPEQIELNRKIVDLAKATCTEYIVTSDAHYVNKDDSYIHSMFVKNAKDNDDGGIYTDCYMLSEEEVRAKLKGLSESEIAAAITTTQKIVDKCVGVELPIGKAEIPMPYLPDGFETEIEYLRHLVYTKFKEKGIDKLPNAAEYKERIEYELDALHKVEYDRYLLNVREQLEGFERIGAGRGSAAGGITCWLSDLTKIDSIKYGCYFERFVDVGQIKLLEEGKLTKEKLKRGDIDIDVATSIRQDVVKSLTDKYGEDKVCAIGTVGMSWAKMAIKDIARVLNIDPTTANTITKDIISQELTDDVIANEIDTKYKEMYPKLFEIAQKITGVVRTMSVHASGKIIADRELSYYAPAAILNGEKTIMCDMHSVDLLMLLKSDILGLRTLDVIFDVLEMINKDYSYVDPNTINLKDKNVFRMFQQGRTDSIFQFSSDGMRNVLKEMKPDNIEDIIAANALFRPGPMKSIPSYIKRKHGREEVEYLHPDLEPILKSTYGIMCYQEQVIEIGRYAEMNNPDDLRVATAKKKPAMLEKIKPEFYSGLMKKGWTIAQVDELFDNLLAYAQYSFNRSHSVAYSLTAYQTMFLHYYHPVEFWCAVLNSYEGKADKIAETFAAVVQDGVSINVPSYKQITEKCVVRDGKLFIGTNVIKGISSRIGREEWLKKIDIRRDSFLDFLLFNTEEMMQGGSKIHNKELEALIKLGFFDSVAEKSEMLDMLEQFNGGKGLKYEKKHTEKTKIKRVEALIEYWKNIKPSKPRITTVVGWEIDYLGVPLSTFKEVPQSFGYVLSVERSGYTNRNGEKDTILTIYGLNSGVTTKAKYGRTMNVAKGSVIEILALSTHAKNGKEYVMPYISRYKKIL